MRGAVALALLVLSCGTPPQRCTTASCKGCCFNDVCLDGTSTSACGRGGLECLTCDPARICLAGACSTPSAGGAGGGSGSTAGGTAGGGSAGGASAGGRGNAGGASAGGNTAGGATAGGATAGGASAGGMGTAGGAAAVLCDETYGVAATPAMQSCLGNAVPWPNPSARVTQHADGGLTMVVDAGAIGIAVLRGSWDAGGGFRATGQGTMNFGGLPLTVAHTVTAQFTTCNAWAGRWLQDATICAFAWDAGATRQ